jgi:glycosyltransferase involved in cell wall biosynthesis
MVPYKKIDLIVEAFNHFSDKSLVVIGDGPDFHKIKKIAKRNTIFLGYQPTDVLKKYMQRAKAFVFAAKEDFGIMPLEAQACGTPVIGYKKGGLRETIHGLDHDLPTGVFFEEQAVHSLIHAVEHFEKNQEKITPLNCRNNALRFSSDRFRLEFNEYVGHCVASHFK